MKSGQFKDLTGNRYGYLKVISYHGRINKQTYWNCKCLLCGNINKYTIANLTRVDRKAIKCLPCSRKLRRKYDDIIKSGEGSKSKIYATWRHYRSKGILCKEWSESSESFKEFYRVVGDPPKYKANSNVKVKRWYLIRLDRDRLMGSDNFCWTHIPAAALRLKENCRREFFHGELLTISEIAKKLGVSKQALYLRLSRLPRLQTGKSDKSDKSVQEIIKYYEQKKQQKQQ